MPYYPSRFETPGTSTAAGVLEPGTPAIVPGDIPAPDTTLPEPAVPGYFPEATAPDCAETLPKLTAGQIALSCARCFQHAQGYADLHNDLQQYVIQQTGIDRIDNSVLDEAHTRLRDITRAVINDPHAHEPQTKASQFQIEIDNAIWNWRHPSATDRTPTELGMGMLAQDYRHIVTQGGRPRSGNPESKRSNQMSRFHSQLIMHGFLGRPTGDPVFDQLYREAAAGLLGLWDQEPTGLYRLTPTVGIEGYVFTMTIGSYLESIAETHFIEYPDDLEELPPAFAEKLIAGSRRLARLITQSPNPS